MLIIGIDPGQSGGICRLLYEAYIFPLIVTKMPNNYIDILGCLRVNQPNTKCYIELVHSFPGQGVASSFKFGMGYGALQMALTALKIPFETVSPQKWQKALGIRSRDKKESKTQFKNRLKIKAQQLFPKHSSQINLSTCDAILIAEYGRRKEKGVL